MAVIKKTLIEWCKAHFNCKAFIAFIVLSAVITLYIVTIPVKEYVPSVTRKILAKNLQLPDIEDVDTNEQGMPKIFHQMWSTDNVPDKLKPIRHTCLEKNKDYTPVIWTHDLMVTFMAKKYPWFLDIYLNYPYQIQRVDVARYFILYHYGGVYLDMDCECKTSFSTIFKNMTKTHSVLVIETDLYGISNGFMGARKQDPFFAFLIDRLPNFAFRYIFRHPTIIISSGPLFVTRSWNNYEGKSSIYVLPLIHFRETYFHERFSGSWHGWDTEIVDLFHFHFPEICLFVVFVIIALLAYKAYYNQTCCGFQLSLRKIPKNQWGFPSKKEVVL